VGRSETPKASPGGDVTYARRLDWPDCRNTRDLGGLACASGITRHGVAIRSDNVSALNTDGVRAMWAYGVNTVVDLRSESEIERSPSPFAPAEYGPTYVHLPLLDDAFFAAMADTRSMADRYKLMVDHRGTAFAQIFTALADADGPAVFHCFASWRLGMPNGLPRHRLTGSTR
jgi:protein-tyrosine phosphatase